MKFDSIGGVCSFKYLGTFVIFLWFALTMFLFFMDYCLFGLFTLLIAYDATKDLLINWANEIEKIGREYDNF